MKRSISLILSLLMILTFCTVPAMAEGTGFTPGTYEGEAASVGGIMKVAVTVSEDKIETIEVLECHDTDGVYDTVVERLPQLIVENQSLNVDGVAGATLSSAALKYAVRSAVEKSGVDVASLQEHIAFTADPVEDMSADVVVVGGGIAGLMTALACANDGRSVVLVEKNGFVGGSAILSERIISNIPFFSPLDEAIFILGENGIDLVECELHAALGLDCRVLADPEEGRSMISSLINKMAAAFVAKGGVILTDTPCTGILTSRGTVSGVTVQARGQENTATINAHATVICTGGYQQNRELVAQYSPQLEGIRVSSAAGSTGDAIAWVEALGGYLNKPELGARGYSVNPKTGYRTTFGYGVSLFVDKTGKVFTETNDYAQAPLDAWDAFGNETYYAIVTESLTQQPGFDWEYFDHMIEAGSTFKFDSIDAIVAEYGLTDLPATLEAAGMAEETSYYVSPSKAAIYTTLGGIATNMNGCVLDTWGEVIHGLYAAGEVAGNFGSQEYGFYTGQLGSSLARATDIARYLENNWDKIGSKTALAFHHIMIGCKDLDLMTDFWTDFMGLQAIGKAHYPVEGAEEGVGVYESMRNGGLCPALCDEMFMHEGQELDVVMCIEPEGRVSLELWSGPQMEINGGDPYWTTGVHELGIMVDDINYWFDKVTAAGYKTTTAEPWWAGSGYSFLFFDPEGNLIQISERGTGPQWQTLAPYVVPSK